MSDPLADMFEAGAKGWWEIKGRHCLIYLEPRSHRPILHLPRSQLR